MAPLRVAIDNDRLPVLAERQLELVCRAFGSRPAAAISWFHAGARLEQAATTTTTLSENATSVVVLSTVSFTPRLELGSDSQSVTCRAENPALASGGGQPSGLLEDTWRLEVHYLPRVRLALGDKLASDDIREGHDVYFECQARGRPQVSELRWRHDGRELETNLTAGVIISNQSLVLQRVQRYQRGQYTCLATNSVGESQSNAIHLRVRHKPVCSDATKRPPAAGAAATSQRLQLGAAKLEPVRVTCQVDADPSEPISFKWAFVAAAAGAAAAAPAAPEFNGQQLVYLDASLISQQAQLEHHQLATSVASYTPRSELDYGLLLCWATNALGQQTEPCQYQLVQAARPEPVAGCRLVNASEAQLVVACEPGYDGGLRQSLQMEVYESRGRQLVANLTAAAGDFGDQFSNHSAAPDWFDQERQDDDGGGDVAQHAGSRWASLVSGGAADQQHQQHQQPAPAKHHQRLRQSQPNKARATTTASDQRQPKPGETVFVTEPVLEPATSYYLSVYATNSVGSSRPLGFTALTANQSAAADQQHLLLSLEASRRNNGKSDAFAPKNTQIEILTTRKFRR